MIVAPFVITLSCQTEPCSCCQRGGSGLGGEPLRQREFDGAMELARGQVWQQLLAIPA